MNHAESFHALHQGDPILVLANVWDAASARVVEMAGARAIATSSAAVSWAHGLADGEHLSREAAVASARSIAAAIRVPLTVDVEGGYSEDPAEVSAFVARIFEAGGVGINLEDGTSPPELLVAKIRAVKKAAKSVFVNARTDVYLKALTQPERAVEETLRRARLYEEAGCDGLFVPGVMEERAIRAITAGTRLPVNVLALAGIAKVPELAGWGVRRVSAGAALASAALATVRTAALELHQSGSYESLFRDRIPSKELNAAFTR